MMFEFLSSEGRTRNGGKSEPIDLLFKLSELSELFILLILLCNDSL